MSRKPTNALFKLISDGDIAAVQTFILSQYTDDSWKYDKHAKSGDTMLHVASRCGHLNLLKWLVLDHSLSIFASNNDGRQPLHDAAQFSQIDCLKFLLEHGAPVDCLKRADWTPLMLACTKKNIEVIKCLVNAGADSRLKNKDGWNSFHIACREGNSEIIDYLLNCDKKLWDVTSKNGRTPLHTAALHGRLDVVKILLQRGNYQSDVTDCCGSTPLMDALRAGYTDIAEILIAVNKADINKEDKMGHTALHLSAQVGCKKSVTWLVCEKDINVNVKSSITGITPLHLAAKEGQHDMLSMLCSLGADVNLMDNQGRTALHLARGGQFTKSIELLQEWSSK